MSSETPSYVKPVFLPVSMVTTSRRRANKEQLVEEVGGGGACITHGKNAASKVEKLRGGSRTNMKNSFHQQNREQKTLVI
jgi:hypothetical protein